MMTWWGLAGLAGLIGSLLLIALPRNQGIWRRCWLVICAASIITNVGLCIFTDTL